MIRGGASRAPALGGRWQQIDGGSSAQAEGNDWGSSTPRRGRYHSGGEKLRRRGGNEHFNRG